jgi:hypothetical protein
VAGTLPRRLGLNTAYSSCGFFGVLLFLSRVPVVAKGALEETLLNGSQEAVGATDSPEPSEKDELEPLSDEEFL